eukprot:UN08542
MKIIQKIDSKLLANFEKELFYHGLLLHIKS